MHRWFKEDENEWSIICDEKKKSFSPQTITFQSGGLCPHCGENARLELDRRKRERQEREIENQRKLEDEENLKNRNTLNRWI